MRYTRHTLQPKGVSDTNREFYPWVKVQQVVNNTPRFTRVTLAEQWVSAGVVSGLNFFDPA